MVRHHYIRPLIALFASLVCSMAAAVLPHQYYQFNNLSGITQDLCVRSIAQTKDGMMWFGTEDGLYSYNGYFMRKCDHAPFDLGSFNFMVAADDSLLIGCERGLLSFNIHTDSFRQLSYAQHQTIKGVLKADGHWWVATEKDIYQDGKRMELSIETIYSIGCDDTYLYIGTTDKVLRYAFKQQTMDNLAADVWIATCFVPSSDGVLWIGAARSVMAWDSSAGISMFSSDVPVAKSLCTDKHGNLLVGTDNGLYIIGKKRSALHILHDARVSESLAGDAVWSLFRDKEDNIWIGTNSGISLVADNDLLTTYTLPSITGESTGCQLFCITRDAKGRCWMGGSNGLICIEHLGKENQTYRWYRIDSSTYPISHNRIRVVFADSSQRVWIGGDGGLFLLDEGTMQLVRYEIDDQANYWVYDIREEKPGELSVTTFDVTYIVDIAAGKLNILRKMPRRDLHARTSELEQLLTRFSLSGHYLSACYDSLSGMLLLGGTDRFSVLHTPQTGKPTSSPTFVVTDIRVNGERWTDHRDIAARAATFSPGDNRLQLFLSDFDYADEWSGRVRYRMTGQEEWVDINTADCSITLPHLEAGTYKLYISCGNNQESDTDPLPVFTIKIKAPWYATTLAKVLYMLLIIGLLYGVYLFLQQRKRLQRERQQRAELLARAKKKEKELLSDNEYLAAQLRLQLIEKSGNNGELSADEKFMLDITRIIEENMDDSDLNVETLSQKSGISTKQLYRRIKALTGMSTVAYIRDQRLKKAASLLSKGSFTVSEVMYMVGFSSASYFTRCFCEEYGVTPSAYNPTPDTNGQ